MQETIASVWLFALGLVVPPVAVLLGGLLLLLPRPGRTRAARKIAAKHAHA